MKKDKRVCVVCSKTKNPMWQCECAITFYCSKRCSDIDWNNYHWFLCFLMSDESACPIIIKSSKVIKKLDSIFGSGKCKHTARVYAKTFLFSPILVTEAITHARIDNRKITKEQETFLKWLKTKTSKTNR